MTQIMGNGYNERLQQMLQIHLYSLYLIAALALIHLLRKCQGRPLHTDTCYGSLIWYLHKNKRVRYHLLL